MAIASDYDNKGEYIQMWVEETRRLEEPQEIFQTWKVPKERWAEVGLEGNEGAEKPLKKIDFRIGGKGSGRGGGGRYGGSSRGKANGAGEGGRGRGGGSFGARGWGRGGRGTGDWGRGGRQGMMDRAHANGAL